MARSAGQKTQLEGGCPMSLPVRMVDPANHVHGGRRGHVRCKSSRPARNGVSPRKGMRWFSR